MSDAPTTQAPEPPVVTLSHETIVDIAKAVVEALHTYEGAGPANAPGPDEPEVDWALVAIASAGGASRERALAIATQVNTERQDGPADTFAAERVMELVAESVPIPTVT